MTDVGDVVEPPAAAPVADTEQAGVESGIGARLDALEQAVADLATMVTALADRKVEAEPRASVRERAREWRNKTNQVGEES